MLKFNFLLFILIFLLKEKNKNSSYYQDQFYFGHILYNNLSKNIFKSKNNNYIMNNTFILIFLKYLII